MKERDVHINKLHFHTHSNNMLYVNSRFERHDMILPFVIWF